MLLAFISILVLLAVFAGAYSALGDKVGSQQRTVLSAMLSGCALLVIIIFDQMRRGKELARARRMKDEKD